MRPSNFELHVIGNPDQLDEALNLALKDQTVKYWKFVDKWFVLAWGVGSGVNWNELPPVHSTEALKMLICETLFDMVVADAEPKLYDGSIYKDGFELAAGSLTMSRMSGSSNPYEVLRIRPTFAMYHK